MQEYIPLYHERMCKSLADFYEKNYIIIQVIKKVHIDIKDILQNLDLIQMINWVMKYGESLKPYGLNDERLINGVHILSNVYSKRLFKTNVGIIMGILKQVKFNSKNQYDECLIDKR